MQFNVQQGNRTNFCDDQFSQTEVCSSLTLRHTELSFVGINEIKHLLHYLEELSVWKEVGCKNWVMNIQILETTVDSKKWSWNFVFTLVGFCVYVF